jgi:hypothetical protein
MPISGIDLLAMTESELTELFQPTKCLICGETLHESTTGCRPIEGGCACSDCYFEAFSKELEQHPICVPRMHRGA